MRTTQPALVRIVIRAAACALLLGSESRIAGAQQAEPAPAPAQAREETPFEEIVVTVQRREQRIQDVGISVTPLGEELLQDLNINTATDIARAASPSCGMNISCSIVLMLRTNACEFRRRSGQRWGSSDPPGRD